jgi:hypothetical protein
MMISVTTTGNTKGSLGWAVAVKQSYYGLWVMKKLL